MGSIPESFKIATGPDMSIVDPQRAVDHRLRTTPIVDKRPHTICDLVLKRIYPSHGIAFLRVNAAVALQLVYLKPFRYFYMTLVSLTSKPV